MRLRPLALIAVFGSTLPAGADELSVIGAYDWDTPSIAGLSGLEVSDDGQDFTAVSDRGWWVSGSFERAGEMIADIDLGSISPILGNDGLPVSARRVADWSDAEGLAIAPGGQTWVSFERWAHVSRYDGPEGPGQWIKDHPTFYDHAENWQLEAVAVDPAGQLYVFSEKPLPEGFPIYRLAETGWVIDGYLPERDVFSIVGADFDLNGDLYLLERKLVVGLWWQNRIRRVRLDGSEDQTLWTGERGQFGNLEGLAVWRDARGLRLTAVSDNNASDSEKTQFVEFRLTE